MKQRIQRPADPEILFDILCSGADSVGGLQVEAASVVVTGSNDFDISVVHDEPAWLFRFLVSLADLAGALFIGSKSRKKSCIHAGNDENPVIRSRRNGPPCLRSASNVAIRFAMRLCSLGSFNFGFSQ